MSRMLPSQYIESLILFCYGSQEEYYADWAHYDKFKKLLYNGYLDDKKDKPSFLGLWAIHLYDNGKLN